jgi:outer membrane lipoprotein-sorting protein
MQRRTLLRLALLAPARLHAQPAFQPTPQDRADIARIEAYLNSIRTLTAHFLQVAPDGAITQGTAWLQRPGHMRFEYDPPSPLLLVTSHQQLVFQDKSINQISEIPLSRTPLSILLADHISLSGDITVTGMEHLPGQLQVTFVRTGSAGDGSLTLVFSDNPLALRQWTVLDAQRRETRVTLYNVEIGGKIDPRVFDWSDPRSFQ